MVHQPLTYSNSGLANFWLQWFQRQVRLSSPELCWDVFEVALEGAGVFDLESLPLLETEEA
jgi:hypothetical protein